MTLAVVAVLTLPLAVVATAFACARLATLKLDRETARPGVQVTAIGRNFNSDPKASPIAIRFNSRNGRVLWEGRPNARGAFKATFEVPSARAGHYVVLATQNVASGAPAAGTPGRAPLRVRRGSAASSRQVALIPPTSGGPTTGGELPSAPLVAGALMLLLALSGAAFGRLSAARRRRPAVRPAAGQLS